MARRLTGCLTDSELSIHLTSISLGYYIKWTWIHLIGVETFYVKPAEYMSPATLPETR